MLELPKSQVMASALNLGQGKCIKIWLLMAVISRYIQQAHVLLHETISIEMVHEIIEKGPSKRELTLWLKKKKK